MLFVGAGAVLLLMILVKYIQIGRELKEWEVGTELGSHSSWRKLSFRLDDGSRITQNVLTQTTGIYDKWLIIRFSIAFVFMM